MSDTHILVEKNGIQDKMNKTVWEAIGGSSNKDGWKQVPLAPVEVIEMKQKQSVVKPEGENVPVAEVAAPVEVKSKVTKKK